MVIRVAVAVAVVAGGSVHAQTLYTWRGGSGAWEDSARWDPTGVPSTPGDAAGIATSGTDAVTLNSRPIIARLALSGSLRVAPAGGLYFIDSITITSGSIRVGQGIAGQEALLAPLAGTSAITALGGGVVLDGNPANVANARVLAPAGGGLVITGTVRGQGVVQGDGTIVNTGQFIASGAGMRLLGSIVQVGGSISGGPLVLDGADVEGGVLAPTGVRARVPGGRAVTLRNVTIASTLGVAVDPAGSLSVESPGIAFGAGQPPVTVLLFGGQLDLSGPLRVSGALPPLCQAFRVVDVAPGALAQITGRLAKAVDPALPPNRRWALQHLPDGVLLRLTCAADFDADCAVDFNDLLAFMNLYNAGDPEADLNGDGAVDFNDFLAFLNAFGLPCP
ncbi:MAG: hypothetical protein FJ255_11485 [Phycisphaerae bacterium]|nr:hypothetical protein [Phycisphaerae bacterium]